MQTKIRTVSCRVKEQIKVFMNNGLKKSEIAEYFQKSGPNQSNGIESHRPRVLSAGRHYIPRLGNQAIEINKPQNLNQEDWLKLSS